MGFSCSCAAMKLSSCGLLCPVAVQFPLLAHQCKLQLSPALIWVQSKYIKKSRNIYGEAELTSFYKKFQTELICWTVQNNVFARKNSYWDNSINSAEWLLIYHFLDLSFGGGFLGIRNRALIGCMSHRAAEIKIRRVKSSSRCWELKNKVQGYIRLC